MRNVEGPLDLDLLPVLGTLGLVSSPGATLDATRPLRALTALYLGGLAPQLSLDATPALPHMCALQEVVVEGFDAGACFASLRATLDPDFCPALRSLDILQVASFSLAATQDLPGLNRLFCDAAGEVGVDLALLPALRELSLPRSAAGVSLAMLGPEVTSLQCSLAACGGLRPASWAALRLLQLWLTMHDGALPGSLVPEGDSLSSQHHGTGQMILPQVSLLPALACLGCALLVLGLVSCALTPLLQPCNTPAASPPALMSCPCNCRAWLLPPPSPG